MFSILLLKVSETVTLSLNVKLVALLHLRVTVGRCVVFAATTVERRRCSLTK